MIEKLKKNTKIKIISLLSAIVLWMYVMAVVDPEDTKLYEDIPITITNLNEINDLDLVVDPDEDLVASVYVKGHLSDLQKITVENINVYGTVNHPIEGQNQLYLRASASDKVTTDFKSDTIVINLEKVIEEERNITLNITGEYANNVDTVKLQNENVKISGPRSRIESVKYIQASFNADKEYTSTYTTDLTLEALDSNKKKVSDVSLEFDTVSAQISFLKQKEVKVNPIFTNSGSDLVEGEDFTLSPDVITIKGKSADIDNIESINTSTIDINDFESNSKVIKLQMPEGVTSDKDSVTIKISSENSLVDTFTYSGDELNLLNNNDENISLDNFNIPNTIKVTLKYAQNSQKISKEDLKLYINLEDGFSSNKQYPIVYRDAAVKSVSIDPSYVTSK
ncbi:MAG: YbbR-like domain-containing protein [Intestinibacter sp.]|uniref:CdaR family protein n=1 Tax=Intestinibacter sp. TaxID=1965304 RepID=UPI003F15BABB